MAKYGPSLLGTGYQQEVHLERLYADVAEYNAMVHVPRAYPHAGRGGRPHRAVPADGVPPHVPGRHPGAPSDADPWSIGAPSRAPQTAPTLVDAPGVPRPGDLRRAAAVLNEGRTVVMLVGAGALGARDEVLRGRRTPRQPDRQDTAWQGGRA